MGFLTDYFNIESDKTEVAVRCPFTHYTESGMPYEENNPSAHVNTESGLFHCKACGAKGNEIQMIQKLLDCKLNTAKKIQKSFNTDEDIYEWNKELLSEKTKQRALSLGISEEVIKQLNIKTPTGQEDTIAFPVFMFNHLLDIRTYNPGGTPKTMSRVGCPNGLVIPFDDWIDTPLTRMTILCAGEKDMAIARSHDLNAITLTGGENTLPSQLTYFRDRHVAICYDNDDAGKQGARKLARTLSKYTKWIKIITKFHEGMENKEDITDYFVKYGKTKNDLVECIKETDWYTPEDDEEEKKCYPLMDLLTASQAENLNKTIRSNVQVEAISDATFSCPSYLTAEKFQANENSLMLEGEIREWELNDESAINILKMVDNNIKEENLKLIYKDLMHILRNEKYVKIEENQRVTIYKCFLTDMYETTDTSQNTQPMEFTAYSINKKLDSGKKYLITHRIVPHPNKGQQLVMIILDVEEANDSVSNFELNESTIESLKTIQNIPGDVEEKMNTLTEKVKGLLGYNGINTLIQSIDLAYNTPLQFNFGNFNNIRAYLDTIIVGESRTGKSSTATALRQLYGLGTFTSLAGNSATIPGLVGGSNKSPSGGYQTKAGIIPQNHKGLIIFEEFGKSNNSVITELTDIRSSNEVRITRVAGTITLPAMVRMISLTNPKTKDGNIRPIAAYPNGIEVLKDLIEAAEDIARYDMIVILPDKGNTQIDPLWIPESPLDEKVYRDRIRWIWSRKAEQIIIDEEVQRGIIEVANGLNTKYEGHIKIFGTEAWKKLTRLSIAVAGYLVSTDKTYEHIVVKNEHVLYAMDYLIKLYDNPTFKLKEYINYEKQFSEIDDEGVARLQDIYDKNPMLILQLEQCNTTSKAILMAATGMEQKDLNGALNRLTKGLFIKFKNHDIFPTERFRKGLNRIKRNTYAPRIGEINAEVQLANDYDTELAGFFASEKSGL